MKGGCFLTKITDVKKDNISKIRKCFYNGRIWTKNEIALSTGISKAGVTNILKELLDERFIVFCGEATSTGGRKSKQYQLNKDFVHIGQIVLMCKADGYHLIGRIVNLLNQVIFENDMIVSYGNGDDLRELGYHLLQLDKSVNVLCLSVPGICEDGFLSVCDFQALEGIDLKKLLTFDRSVELIVENDVNIASIGLSYYFHQENLAFFYQPAVEYVGCGLIIHNQLYNGFSHFAGELRYLPFYDHDYQQRMLKEDPLELLRLQVETVCCVINPPFVCLCSDVTDVEKMVLNLPKQHCPQISVIHDMNYYLFEGLYHIVIKNLMKGAENGESRLSCTYSL